MRVQTLVNTILKFASENGYEISHLKLQKLLYFFNGEYLVQTDRPLIDEIFEAWQYGPIIRKVFDFYKDFGGKPLETHYFPVVIRETKESKIFVVEDKDGEFWDIFKASWLKYGHLSAEQLSTLAHSTDSPWKKCKWLYEPLNTDTIKSHFKEKQNIRYI